MTYNQSPAHPPEHESHGALYFIVGGLLVFAVIVAAFIFNANRAENSGYAPSSGFETSTSNSNQTAPATTNNNTEAPAEQAPLAP
jgi:hypothetical protein